MKITTSLIAFLTALFVCTCFLLYSLAANNGKSDNVITNIEKLNQLILNYNDQNKYEIIEDNLKKQPENKQLLEFKLDLMYATDLFSFFWNEKDYDDSIKIIEKLKNANYSRPKMFLYEGLYYKNKGEWVIAEQLVDHASKQLLQCEQTPENKYYYSRALLEKGIFTENQATIIDAIENLEIVLNKKPNNIIYLSTINEMFRYIEVPEDLYQAYYDRIMLYQAAMTSIQDKLTLKNSTNLLYRKNKRDNSYFEEVMLPLTKEILRKWKVAKTVQDQPADLLYVFQLTEDRRIINIKLISADNATNELKIISHNAIKNAIISYLPENYPLYTMNILFVFSFH